MKSSCPTVCLCRTSIDPINPTLFPPPSKYNFDIKTTSLGDLQIHIYNNNKFKLSDIWP